jgi:hypothetical protein
MSRNTGTFNFAANFEGLSKAPIDAKQLVGTYADLTLPATWCASGSVWLYDGAIVSVASGVNRGLFYLCDANNYTLTNSWIKVGSGSGTLTGATNGLHLSNSGTTVGLGGNLLSGTTINGGGLYSLSLSNLTDFQISTSGLTTIFGIDNVGLLFSFSGGSISYEDNGGIKYGGDYESYFTNRSLITKQYVDEIVTGLKPKQAVKVATTTNLTYPFNGLLTIDGITLSNGDRVLVKNQIPFIPSGKTNGIWIASASTWTRATDFDGTPLGEVVSGSYVWVLSGNTNKNTSWVLATDDPIIVGTTPLLFVYFNHVTDVQAGTGITVTTSGTTHIVSLNDVTQDILAASVTGATNGICKYGNHDICLDSTIFSSVLTGVTGGLTKYTCHDVCLSTITQNTLNTSVTGATNGICKYDNHNICLDGTIFNSVLTGATNGICKYDNHNVCLTTIIQNTLNISVTGATNGICKYGNHDVCLTTETQAILNSALTGATNGLTKQGQQVKLGGNLTGSTIINLCNNSLCLQSDSTNIYGLADFSLNSIYSDSKFNICSQNGSSAQWGLSGNSVNIGMYHCINLSNGSNINIYNTGITFTNKCSSALKIVNLGNSGLTYGGNYCNNNPRWIPDKEYVDGQISGTSNLVKIKLNGYYCTLNQNYYTYNCDDIIAVSGVSSHPIFLPASPTIVCNHTQKITFVDICGNALADPITINGNGNNINNGGYSTINTDYGSITFVYNGIFWSAIAFVN